jgi:lactate dehydrogenase-like 2-hydroxyacid dehydrogenase
VTDASFGDRDRERLFALLSAHAAADHIDLEELERRVVAVSEADGRATAEQVLADLPALPDSVLRAATADAPGFGDRPASPGAEAGRPRWRRGHGDSERAADGWRATDERFRDPKTRRVMRVWEDAAGGRHYVPDD